MSPLGERTRPEAYTESETVPVRVVLENIRSGLNVGAFFRTADAFRISGIDLCGYTAHPPQRDILKSALGADEHVPWSAHSDALSA
ncbi:MAG: TrmH family RNA methyltransferase, partial [Flavobacteriales bacterium]|nr:TrmH family RNA methyltransferase [Flavobacteriales bacterium]